MRREINLNGGGMGAELRDEVNITRCILCTDTVTFSSREFKFWTLEKPSREGIK
jgi:hypothetical protein